MRVTVEIGGRPTLVEVADDLASVRVGDRSFPVRVVDRGPARLELEIGGETVVVDGWPERFPAPPGPVDVNGERWTVRVAAEASARAPAAQGSPAGPAGAPGAGGVAPAGAIAVAPPMPGRVVEVRVAVGQAVTKGSVLLVLEAMKMRNEVAAPADGVVRELRVREGANVRARETMVVIGPAG